MHQPVRCIVFAAIFPWLLPRAMAYCEEITPLDMNSDGAVTILGDLTGIVDCLVFDDCPEDEQCRVDCNGDGLVTVLGDLPCIVSCLLYGQCPCTPLLLRSQGCTFGVTYADPANGCIMGDVAFPDIEVFDDFETALCRAIESNKRSSDCYVISSGVCDNGLLFIDQSGGLGGQRHVFDPETHDFVAMREGYDIWCSEGCWVGYWPQVIDCSVTEVVDHTSCSWQR